MAKLTHIHTVEIKGIPIDLYYRNGQIAYSFEHNGEHFGSKIKLNSRKVLDIVSATCLLFVNALDSAEAVGKLKKDDQ